MLLFVQNLCNAAPPLEFSTLDFLLDFSTSQTQHIAFHPENGLKNREHFEQKYGQRGEKLIAALGSGSPGVLDYQQQPLVHNLSLCFLLIIIFLLVLTINSAGSNVHLMYIAV
jgi:hypothetical protein